MLVIRLTEELLEDESSDTLFASLESAGGECCVLFPLSSIGRASSHLPIASNFAEAAFIGELLLPLCLSLTAKLETVDQYYAQVKFTGRVLNSRDFADSLMRLAKFFDPEEEEFEGLEDISEAFADFRDKVWYEAVSFPELADSYMLNEVVGQGYENIGDDPEEWEQFFPTHPEARFEYITSNISYILGGRCLISSHVIAAESHVDLRKVLTFAGQTVDEMDEVGKPVERVLTVPDVSVFSDGMIVVDVSWRFVEECISMLRECFDAQYIQSHTFKLHPQGEHFVVSMQGWNLILFSGTVRVLPAIAVEFLLERMNQSTDTLRSALGRPTVTRCAWETLGDDEFERLCWDVLVLQDRFDSASLKKMGKSRSRDGGRDIEVTTLGRFGNESKKWIYQCKAIKPSSSLPGSKVTISDVIDQYGAQGFGVMTSGVVDATLWDKLNEITGRRNIGQDVWDQLRLEHFLANHREIRERYFGR